MVHNAYEAVTNNCRFRLKIGDSDAACKDTLWSRSDIFTPPLGKTPQLGDDRPLFPNFFCFLLVFNVLKCKFALRVCLHHPNNFVYPPALHFKFLEISLLWCQYVTMSLNSCITSRCFQSEMTSVFWTMKNLPL